MLREIIYKGESPATPKIVHLRMPMYYSHTMSPEDAKCFKKIKFQNLPQYFVDEFDIVFVNTQLLTGKLLFVPIKETEQELLKLFK